MRCVRLYHVQGVIGEINQSSQRAMTATSKAATDLRDLLHRMQPLVTTMKHGKKTRCAHSPSSA
jgi:hypothetical protein